MRREGTPKRRLALTLAVLACAPAAFAAAAGAMPGMTGPRVEMATQAFVAPQVTAVAGDTVTWTNTSIRAHTVTADDGSFDSGRVLPGGTFTQRFDTPGVYTYHCQIHPGMVGQVDVVRVALDPVTHAAAPNVPLLLTGRAALPPGSTVTIQGDDGSGYRTLATAIVGAGGMFSATVTPRTTTQFRAVPAGDAASSPGASPSEQVLVVDRKVSARVVRRGARRWVLATVTPASPGSIVVLEMKLRQHFGWWPVTQKRVDRHSQARFRLPKGSQAPARVVLTLRDGVTPLAQSLTLRLGGHGHAPHRPKRHNTTH